jgi:hypothetical protein
VRISFISARPAGLRSVKALSDGHGEGLAGGRHEAREVLADLTDPPGRIFDIALGIADLAADGELVVLMRGAQPFEPGDVGFEPRLLHQALDRRTRSPWPWRTGWPALHRGPQPADRGVAGERRGDEAGLALVVLPHGGVERALGGIGEDVDLVVLVALAHDAALALLDLRGQPGHVEMVQRLQPELRIDAGAHRVGRADQEADLAGANVAEQALLGLGLLEVLHEGDLGCRHAQRTSSSRIQR